MTQTPQGSSFQSIFGIFENKLDLLGLSMRTEAEIEETIQHGRTNHFDIFTESATVTSIAETMVAFANSGGGHLVVGVDRGNVVGIRDRVYAFDKLIEAALSTDPPLIIPLPKVVMIEEAPVVVAQIPSGMPHVYAYEGRYLKRDKIYNAPLTPRDLRRLMIERGEINFEANICDGATLDDIDWTKARDYAQKLSGFSDMDVKQVLLKRGCLTTLDDELYPTNAGILLFGREPQRHIVGSDITGVRFAGETMGDTFARQDIGGTLIDQVRLAETFLVDHLRKHVTLRDTMQREESYEYPMEAARELVVNAVAHRDYSVRGDNIRIFIFSNRMEVYSPGSLPGPMTIENLKDERFSRNPILVQVLADFNFIEKLGYGVDRVMELMKEKNLQDPDFAERAGGFKVILHNAAVIPLEDDFYRPRKVQEFGNGIMLPIIDFGGMYNGHEVNARQEAALVYLKHTEHTRITNSDLGEMFPDVHAETLRRDLSDLVAKNILVKMGQKRGSFYILNTNTDSE